LHYTSKLPATTLFSVNSALKQRQQEKSIFKSDKLSFFKKSSGEKEKKEEKGKKDKSSTSSSDSKSASES
jgi:hypothetical protein